MIDPDESTRTIIRSAIVLSRWLVAPFWLGLLLSFFLLMYRFVADFIALTMRLAELNWHDVIAGVLHLLAFYLTATLVLVVAFYIHGLFMRKNSECPNLPQILIQRDFGTFQQRLLGIISAVAAVEALAWYLDPTTLSEGSKAGWVMAFPLMFGAATVMLAIAARLGSR